MSIISAANDNISKLNFRSLSYKGWEIDVPSDSSADYYLFSAYILSCLTFVLLSWYCWKKGLKIAIKKAYLWYMGNSRAGEPPWVEYSRLVTKLTLTFIFWAYFAYNISMIESNPKVDLTAEKRFSSVLNPDIRLCFTGVLYANVTALCSEATASGKFTNCKESSNVPLFNKSKYYPYSTYKQQHSLVNYLFFTAHQSFPVDLAANGLQLFYDYILDDSSSMHTLQIEVYNPHVPHPNVFTYFDHVPDDYMQDETASLQLENPRQQLETQEYIRWSAYEVSDDNALKHKIEDNTRYSLDLKSNESSHLTIDFRYETHYKLSDSAWNVIGFPLIYGKTQEIIPDFETEIKKNDSNPTYNPAASIIRVYPTNYKDVTISEKRIYTLVNTLGSVGGLFALLVAIHSLLYGARPVSPYGIVHRYSPKKLKASLRNALYDRFGFLERPIPLVHPVDQTALYHNEHLMQKDHGLTICSTTSNKDKDLRVTSYRNVEGEDEMLSTSAIPAQQAVHDRSEATAKLQHNMATNTSTTTISSDATYLEDGFNQLRSEFARQQEMCQRLENDNDMIKSKYNELQRRQQLMEIVLKAYYLDDEVLQELNKAHENSDLANIKHSDNRHDDDDITINMDTPEAPSNTLQSRIRTALQRPFRRRQQRQQRMNNEDCSTGQALSVKYIQTPTTDVEEQLLMADRSDRDDNAIPSKPTKDI